MEVSNFFYFNIESYPKGIPTEQTFDSILKK